MSDKHALTLETNRGTLWTGWAFRAHCLCGWTSGSLWLSRKRAGRSYYKHLSALAARSPSRTEREAE